MKSFTVFSVLAFLIVTQSCGVTHQYYVANAGRKEDVMNTLRTDQLNVSWNMLRNPKAGDMTVGFSFDRDMPAVVINNMMVSVQTPEDSVFRLKEITGNCREDNLRGGDQNHPIKNFTALPEALRMTTINRHKVFFFFHLKAPAIAVPKSLTLHYKIDLIDTTMEKSLELRLYNSRYIAIH